MTVLVDKLEKELARNCRLNNWDLGFQAAIDIVKQHSDWQNLSSDTQLQDGQTDTEQINHRQSLHQYQHRHQR